MYDIYPFISPLAGLKDGAQGRTVLVTGGGKGIEKVRRIGLVRKKSLSRCRH